MSKKISGTPAASYLVSSRREATGLGPEPGREPAQKLLENKTGDIWNALWEHLLNPNDPISFAISGNGYAVVGTVGYSLNRPNSGFPEMTDGTRRLASAG